MSPLVSVCVDWKGEVEVEVEKRTSYPTWNVKISLIATYLEESKEDRIREEEREEDEREEDERREEKSRVV